MMNTCSICHNKFDNAELLQSSEDDFFCKECFKYEYCSVSERKKGPIANDHVGDSLSKPTKMFPLLALTNLKKERERSTNSTTSKRPLQCPHVDCHRHVSIFDLNAHFQHEHMDVPITQTTLDARNPLRFYPKDIRYGMKQCLLLFNLVLPPTSDDGANETMPITIVVLASRIAAATQIHHDDHDDDDDDNGVGDYYEDEEESGIFSNQDKIIIWIASNIICKQSYTVAISTINEDIRVKYYGPILQLGHSPMKLCKQGHCLILSHFHFLGMSENGSKPIQLDVIIHSDD